MAIDETYAGQGKTMNAKDFFVGNLLLGKTALVTGGGSGIGQAIAAGLGQVGANIVIASRSEQKLDAAVTAMKAQGISASYEIVDVRDSAAVTEMVARLDEANGGIDILVNNAGGTFPKKSEELSANGWRAVVDVNLNGTFNCCSAVGRGMIARKRGGKIVNIVIGTVGGASGGIVHTGASRAGVAHMTRTLALEWARFNIQVNAIGPQYLTDGAREMYGSAVDEFILARTPAGRWAHSHELGAVAVVLSSPISDYITGVTIPVDGGNWIGQGIDFRDSAVLPE
jgi:NAD(P)-dependent dehydrogenase (short-subunit alcohol dehydrogenase family)